MKRSISLIAGILVFGACCLRADELKLKDGTKIVGTIVGFEENSFKVKTSYGYAVVDRDQVVSINIADTAKKPDAPKPSGAVKQDTKPPDVKSSDAASKPESAAEKPPSTAPAKTEPAPVPSVQRASAAQPAPQPESNAPPVHASAASSTPAPSSAVANPTPNAPKSNAAALAAANAPAAPVAAPAPKPAVPEPIREEVVGNSYVNETYGFRMYKPPDWEMIAGARTILPGAIAALGNGDQTTYLLIGQDPPGKSLASDMNATEQHLREFMDNFRSLGEKRIAISGNDAIERRFRGTVDEHDWSGTVVLVPRAGKVYTIFGMTYADTDLVQIQENVIARAIASLQFTN